MSHLFSVASIAYPFFDPVAFRFGPVSVRWYGIAYVVGFSIGYAILTRMVRRGSLRLSLDSLSDLLGWLIAGVLVGGWLGWWVAYHRAEGVAEPWYEPVAMWHGGMSFHGGLIGVVLVLLVWSWRRKAPLWNLADAMALVAPVGLMLGRVANFANAELVGRPTDLPWGVIFPGESFARHPSQLYEAFMEGPLLMLLLWVALRHIRPRDGQIAALFLALYGVFRFTIEFTRQPDQQLGFIAFGWLTMGQLLSIVTAVGGIGLAMYLAQGAYAPVGRVQQESATEARP